MRIFRIVYLVVILVASFNVKAQIPAKGADFATLTDLHWGMTIQAAGDYLRGKVEVKVVGSSICYKESIVDNEMDIKLLFFKKDSLLLLYSIVAYLKEPDEDVLQIIENKFINRYGDKYEHKNDPGEDEKIENEKKLWRLKNENVELKVATHQRNRLGLSITYKSTVLNRNLLPTLIPLKGSDFPFLANLHWKMTMQAASNSISCKRGSINAASSTLIFEDIILNSKAKVLLKFDDTDSLLMLHSIEVKVMDPNKELLLAIEKRMIASYGSKYENKKESISKFIFTFEFDSKEWQFDYETIILESLSHGDDVNGMKLIYKYNDSRH
jgi:hypothetical protein